MYTAKRPPWRPAIIFITLVSFFLVACGARLTNASWPGLTAIGNTVYVAYGPGVVAVDVAERQELWTFPAELEATLQFYAAPSVQDSRVIVGDFGRTGGFFSPETVVTVYALDGDGSGTPDTEWTRDDLATDHIIAPLLQVGEQVFVGAAATDINPDQAGLQRWLNQPSGNMIALEADSGLEIWRFPTGHSIWAQPVYDEGVLYVSSMDKSVYALKANNGDELWQASFGGAVASSPVLYEDTVYVTAFDQRLHALDKADGHEKWSADGQGFIWGSPAVSEMGVFFADGSGNIYAYSHNGELQWQVEVAGAVQNTPLYLDGVLYVAVAEMEGDEDERQGQLLALRAEDGAQLWQAQTPVPLFTSPAVTDEGIVVALQNSSALFQVYDKDSGARLWEFIPQSDE